MVSTYSDLDILYLLHTYILVDVLTEKYFVSKHPIQPECGERAGWRGTGWPNPSHETKLSDPNGDKGIFKCPVQLIMSRFIGNRTRVDQCCPHYVILEKPYSVR